MYKLLIADDEPIVLAGLRSFDWNSCGFEVTATAKNGLYALEYLRDDPPDAVLSDIKMPQMDGIQLLRQVSQANPETEFIFLTGYADFKYAKEAIKYGAFDYLLKPVDFDELTDVMLRLKEKIHQRKMKKAQLLALLKQEQAQMPRDLQIVPEFFSGSLILAESFQNLKVTAERQLVVIGFGRCAGKGNVDHADISFVLEKELEQTMGLLPEDLVVKSFKNSCCVLLVLKREPPIFQQLAVLEEVCRKTGYYLKEKLGVAVPFVISEAVADLIQVDNLRIQVEILLEATRFCSGNPVLTYRGYQNQEYGLWIFSDKLKNELFQSLSADEPQQVMQLTQNWLKALPEGADLAAAKLRFNAFLLEYLQYFNEMANSEVDSQKQANRLYGRIIGLIEESQKSESLDKFRKTLQEGLLLLTGCGAVTDISRVISKKASLVEGILIRIRQEYFRELSLEEFSEKYGVSKPYLSKVIKEQTGRSFMDLLTSQRLRAACKLLENQDLRIKDVSEMVGYTDDSYFIKVFKKEFGMTPSEYRRFTI